jgi:hypothetical protein
MKLRISTSFGWWAALLATGLSLALVPMAAAAAGMKPLSAGIGLEGRQAHPDYPLKLVFATAKGEYLADVEVSLYDTSGKQVLKAHSAGPWLFLDVPAGQYKVKATRKDGSLTTAMVNVSGDHQLVANLAWKAKS